MEQLRSPKADLKRPEVSKQSSHLRGSRNQIAKECLRVKGSLLGLGETNLEESKKVAWDSGGNRPGGSSKGVVTISVSSLPTTAVCLSAHQLCSPVPPRPLGVAYEGVSLHGLFYDI